MSGYRHKRLLAPHCLPLVEGKRKKATSHVSRNKVRTIDISTISAGRFTLVSA